LHHLISTSAKFANGHNFFKSEIKLVSFCHNIGAYFLATVDSQSLIDMIKGLLHWAV